jgi:sarcosine oxidase
VIHVAVIGAGAFGGWSALHLLRQGAKVTLLDAWGPGHSRASSGGETRIIRSIYGADQPYVEMAARSLQLWKENEKRWGRSLYHKAGILFLAGSHDEFIDASLPLLRYADISFEELAASEASRRYPQMSFDGIDRVIYEPEAGYLTARQNCQTLTEEFQREGGHYRQAAVLTPQISGSRMQGVTLSNGEQLKADAYVFACGPWLGKLFPDVIGDLVRPSKQEVFFWGTPAGDRRYEAQSLPCWSDRTVKSLFYGIPDVQHRGLKFAYDVRGPLFDPNADERVVAPESVALAKEYLNLRFPSLRGAPLVETRVCQYENTPDLHFIIDRHPEARNVLLVGGGSGHGYKHGPAVGEYVAKLVLNQVSVNRFFSLSRFPGKSQQIRH